MSEKIVVPVLGESITEATVSKWLKTVGDTVEVDEPIVELETDKVNLEVPSPVSGVLIKINSKDGNLEVVVRDDVEPHARVLVTHATTNIGINNKGKPAISASHVNGNSSYMEAT